MMEQTEKMIANRKYRISSIEKINADLLQKENYPAIYRNMATVLEKHFDTALIRWRWGESPVSDFYAALETSKKLLNAISDWELEDSTLIGYGYIWELVRYICFLLERPAELPVDRLPKIRAELAGDAADIALDYHLLDAIEGKEWREGLDEPFERLASKKRQALAVETYQTYFALLDAAGDDAQIDVLVRQAEGNYKKRSRNAFYGGGPTYMGGGPDNPYVVDYSLASILKKIGWKGDSVHRWKWH